MNSMIEDALRYVLVPRADASHGRIRISRLSYHHDERERLINLAKLRICPES
jgi:hypothetical protein